MAQFASNLEKNKEATLDGNKVRLLIENFFAKLSS